MMQEEYPDLHQYARLNTLLCFGDQPSFAMLRKLRAQGQIAIPLISRLGPFHICSDRNLPIKYIMPLKMTSKVLTRFSV